MVSDFFCSEAWRELATTRCEKTGNGKLLEVVGKAIVAAIEKSAGLRRALQHQRAAWADAQRQLLGVARAIHNFQRVVVQAGIHFHCATESCMARTSLTSATGSSASQRIFADATRLRRISRSVSGEG